MKTFFRKSRWLDMILSVPVPVKIMGIAVGAAALFGGGMVYVGMPLILKGHRFSLQLVLVILVFAAISILVAFALTAVLSRPIRELVEAARAVGRGDLKARARVWADDEIGHLSRAFNEMTENIRQKEAKHVYLIGKVISAQEEERARIARDLHDQTGQSLTSLILGLKALESGCDQCAKAGGHLNHLIALASQTLEEIHEMAVTLRPNVLDDLGLVTAIQRQVEVCRKRFQVEVDFQTIGFTEKQRLPRDAEVALYRVLQEAITNAVRHARASSVNILLQQRNGTLLAVIEDDGRGFDAAHWRENCLREERLGLFGMEERVTLLGGKFTVESGNGRSGAAIFIEVPVTHDGGVGHPQCDVVIAGETQPTVAPNGKAPHG
ncbi:MAG: sensor histidine kinase [Verrucomicrobia bacterium]|nr:sensor histidine kinase [Verrucomicrobiota bacterium]